MALSVSVWGAPRTQKADTVSDYYKVARVKEVLPPQNGPVSFSKPHANLGDVDFADMQDIDLQGMPTVVYEIFDVATIERGGDVAAGSGTSTVFYEPRDEGVGFFGLLQYKDHLAGGGVPPGGNWHSHWIRMGNWKAGGYVTEYGMRLFNSSANSGTGIFRTSLWDGDPLGFFDTLCSAGGIPAPFAGTTVTFPPVPQAFLADFHAIIGKAQINCDTAWMTLEPLMGCRVAWRIGGPAADDLPAIVGTPLGFLLPYSSAETVAPLLCCRNDNPCTVATALADCGHASMCSDRVVEALGGGFTDEAATPPYYAGFVANMYATANLKMFGLPLSADTKPEDPDTTGWTVSGNEILLDKPNRPIWLDWFVSDWDPTEIGDADHKVKAFQVWLDASTYAFDVAGSVTPHAPACAANATCNNLIGVAPGSECRDSNGDTIIDRCSPAYVRNSRNDYIFKGSGELGPAVDVSTTEPRWVSAMNQGFNASIWSCDGGLSVGKPCNTVDCPDPNAACSLNCGGIPSVIPDGRCRPSHIDRYLGTGAFMVSSDARGTATLTPYQPPKSFLLDDNSIPFPFMAVEGVKVTVVVGQCCNLAVQPFECLWDTGIANECEAQGGNFQAGKTCADDCGCTDDIQCNDSNPCTLDICNDQSQCQSDPIHDPLVTCCDPADGTLLPVNDNNVCTDDLCHTDTGIVDHTPVAEFTACGDATDTQCNDPDSCDAAGNCVNRAASSNTPCDGGALQCFYNLCDGVGNCNAAVDLDVNDFAPCTDDQDCIDLGGGGGSASTATCVGGQCECIACFTNLPCTDPLACSADVNLVVDGDNCYETGEKVIVDIVASGSLKALNAGQFSISYDPTCLDFQGITTGGAMTTVLAQEVNEAAGTIFWAVGLGLTQGNWCVNPLGNPFECDSAEGLATCDAIGGKCHAMGEPGYVCQLGDVDFGTITFNKVGDCEACEACIVAGVNPRDTFLSACHSPGQNDGGYVCVDTDDNCTKPIDSVITVDLTVPGDQKVNVDCDNRTAIVNWAAPSGSSSCGNDVAITCEGHNGNIPLNHACMTGGELPVGLNQFCATVHKAGACAESDETDCWTVEVNEETSLDVTVQLSPIIWADAMTRCINFELYSDCVQDPFLFQIELPFGGAFDHIGHFTDSIKIPDSGQWICICAKDIQHTLRACDFLECVDGDYVAVFKGDPFFGGNWLIGGNLDGWKKNNPNASHDAIDILDFGQYIAEWGSNYGGANQDCETKQQANADINGDGIVDGLDFAFISLNFMEESKDGCCPGSVAGNRTVRTEVSVTELRQMGLGDLAVADLDGNGLVNTDDMAAFMAGATPTNKDRDVRKGTGIRSSSSR